MLTTEIRRAGCFSRWWTVQLQGPSDMRATSAFQRAFTELQAKGQKTPQGLVFRYKDARAIQQKAGRYYAGSSTAARKRVN